jgi:hypothetical protein
MKLDRHIMAERTVEDESVYRLLVILEERLPDIMLEELVENGEVWIICPRVSQSACVAWLRLR